MSGANANDDGTVTELAETPREGISHSHTDTQRRTLTAHAFVLCDTGQLTSLNFKGYYEKKYPSIKQRHRKTLEVLGLLYIKVYVKLSA